MITDVHAHIVDDGLVRELTAEVPDIAPRIEADGGAWTFVYPSGRRSGPVPAGMFDIEARLADMDRQGVDVQALSVPPTHFAYDLDESAAAAAARLHNDSMVDAARAHPRRFRVLGTLPLQHPDIALAELERLRGLPEVVGLEIGTNVGGRTLDHPSLADFWAAAEAAGMVVVLHPDNVAGGERMRSHYLQNFVGNPTDTTLAAGSLIFGGVMSRHPGLRIVLLHGGGFLPYQIGRFDHGWSVRPEPRRHLDVRPSSLLDRFWFDTLTHDPASLQFLLQRVGPARLCLGSDYPFDMADPDPVTSVRRALGDDANTLSAVLEATPQALLRRTAFVDRR